MVLMAKGDGSTFNNSHKETQEALNWFKDNTYINGDVLHWGRSTSGRERSKAYLFKPAGCVSNRGYIQVRKGRDKFMAHRIIWAMHYGVWPSSGIDHINGDKLDNRIENMRESTQFQNSKNAAKYPRDEAWIATGVRRNGLKWVSTVQKDHAKMHLGTFNCHTAAMIARKLFDQSNGFTVRHGSIA